MPRWRLKPRPTMTRVKRLMTDKISSFAHLCGEAAKIGALKNVVFHTPVSKASERLTKRD